MYSYIKRDKSVSGAFLKNLFVLLQIFVNTEETQTHYRADLAL
jgi:hypothetical protein